MNVQTEYCSTGCDAGEYNVSDADGFIDEVAEEVRREKLYGYIRRYGWIAVLAVLALVGGAAFNEYRNAQARSAAEATGDALLSALNEEDPALRAEAIADVSVDGQAVAVAALLTAATQEEAGDIDAAKATLNAIAVDADIQEKYRELAAFKLAMLPSDDVAARLLALEQLARPGNPFRLLALEQMAHAQLQGGVTEAAIATLRAVEEDAAVSRGLKERVQTLMVALGEPLPEPVTAPVNE